MWKIRFTRSATKQTKRLNKKPLYALRLLVEDLKNFGPFPGKSWQNYSKLKAKKNCDYRHCHLIKGKPTYVCCWSVPYNNKKIIEVYYVGTHEKAPY